MNYRNRALLDLAHELHTCTMCGKYVPEGLEPAHANGIEYGKGFGIKSPDYWFAACCHWCHSDLDQGPRPKADKRADWLRAYAKTMAALWEGGLIQVTRR